MKNSKATPLSVWMINNPIASTLLMLTLIISGLLSFGVIKQETSPSFQINKIIIEAEYLGATPKDIEQSIVLPIEYKLIDNADIERLSAESSEGSALITLELVEGIDENIALTKIKNSIDSINSFPDEMEKVSVTLAEEYDSIVELGLHGDLTELQLYQEASRLKLELLNNLDLAKIDIQGARSPEIVIEISNANLLKYQLTLEQILSRVKASVTDISTGSVSTQSGEILIRTLGRKKLTSQFSKIEIANDKNGHRLLLGDIATVRNSFQGDKKPFLINNEPGLELKLYQQKTSKPIELSSAIKEFIEEYKQNVPSNLNITTLQDQSEPFSQRVNLLTSNGLVGMILVVFVLSLFLDMRLAFWVSMGIPVSILGSLGIMPFLDIPLNMITLFAFVITIGILVDDAVVVAENIYSKLQQGVNTDKALKDGVKEMTLPVVFSVLTNIIAFIPLLFVPGELGVMYKPMTLLIFAIFLVSLIEALLILPLHLRNIGKPIKIKTITRIQQRCFNYFNDFKDKVYSRWLRYSCNHPTIVITIFSSLLILVFAWVYSGRVDASFVPKIESTRIDAEVEFPTGMALEDKENIIAYIERSGIAAMEKLNGTEAYKFRMQDIGSNSGSSTFMIVPEDQRLFSARDFVDQWRNKIGDLAGIKSIFFDYQVGPGGGKELVIELGHNDEGTLKIAATELMDGLARITGITDIDSALVDGKLQYNLSPTPLGKSLGFTSDSLGKQVRLHFFGGEAKRQIINGDEVKVRVIMDKDEHYYANQLERLIIFSPSGETVELGQVANISTTKAVTLINRIDGSQYVEVTASILRKLTTASLAIKVIEEELISDLEQKYPDLSIELGGEARIESKANTEIFKGIALAFALVFAMLAVIFRSYSDAVLVLFVIPFSVAAAMLGHIVMGSPFSIMSLFGMIAVSGIVINGSFVMLLKTRTLCKEGVNKKEAVIEAALNRFRPVVLTAITTAAGLVPMLFETSTQALYLIPMVISLSFGTVFSIATILLLCPAIFILSRGDDASLNVTR
ncbi:MULTISPECIES: efflux RND transporter permease subunit [unclassified Pseudoalteromonas]|uniref:efflux RND transporter permease subunit n=1 Tax=unclassified Pseudoalteromonas TaxID=194690 RepID=UPI00390C6C56